ncbi:MAG TPA: hypothetical protein VN962_27615 [Polyangia bacterium]|nr:hypothetical protein [Polyangia bacterium]
MKLKEHAAVVVAILTMSLTSLVGGRVGATEAAPAAAPAPAMIPLAPPAATLTAPAAPEAAGDPGSSTKPAQLLGSDGRCDHLLDRHCRVFPLPLDVSKAGRKRPPGSTVDAEPRQFPPLRPPVEK